MIIHHLRGTSGYAQFSQITNYPSYILHKFFIQTCGDLQRVRPYIEILHTIEFMVAATDSTASENATIGYIAKVNENGTVQNSMRFNQSFTNCSEHICTPSTSFGSPYLARTANLKTHFLYEAFSDDTYNQNLGTLSKTNFNALPYLTIYYGELGLNENSGTMAYNGGSPQVLEEGLGAYGALTTTGIYPWAITALDVDNYHNDKRIQVKVRLFSGTAWTIAYTKLVGDTSDIYPYDDTSVHFAYKSTDNDSCNYVRVGVTDGGTSAGVLVGPISASTSGGSSATADGAIGDNAITSCDVAKGTMEPCIVIMKGCQSSVANDSSSYGCSAERRVSEISEFTLSADGSTLGSERVIAYEATDEDDLTLIDVHRDTTNSKWAYVIESDNNSSGNGLGDYIVTKYGTGSTNYSAYTFTFSDGNAAGTIFDFIPIDNNRYLATFIDENLGEGESLYGGLLQTDATLTTSGHDLSF